MSKIVKMEQPKITKWKIELLEEAEKVFCGEKEPSLNVKELYIKSWSVEEHRKSFARLHRQANLIRKIITLVAVDYQKIFSSFLEKKTKDKDEITKKLPSIQEVKTSEELMAEAKVAIQVAMETFNICDIEEIFNTFKTFFSEMSSKVIFADEDMQHPVSIDELFSEAFDGQDILYLCSAYYTLFLQSVLTPRVR
jgi:hypothetical protein